MPFLWYRKHFPDQEKKPCFFNNEDQTPEKHEKISEQQNRHLRAQNVKNTPQLLGFVIFLITSEMSNKVSLSNKKGVWGLFFGEGGFNGVSILIHQAETQLLKAEISNHHFTLIISLDINLLVFVQVS